MNSFYVKQATGNSAPHGPYSAEQLRMLSSSGVLGDSHLASSDGRMWVSLRQILAENRQAPPAMALLKIKVPSATITSLAEPDSPDHDGSGDSYYFLPANGEGHPKGPFDAEEIARYRHEGLIHDSHLVAQVGDDAWKSVIDVFGIAKKKMTSAHFPNKAKGHLTATSVANGDYAEARNTHRRYSAQVSASVKRICMAVATVVLIPVLILTALYVKDKYNHQVKPSAASSSQEQVTYKQRIEDAADQKNEARYERYGYLLNLRKRNPNAPELRELEAMEAEAQARRDAETDSGTTPTTMAMEARGLKGGPVNRGLTVTGE